MRPEEGFLHEVAYRLGFLHFRKGYFARHRVFLVLAVGIEPTTFGSRNRRSPKLSYTKADRNDGRARVFWEENLRQHDESYWRFMHLGVAL